MWSSIQSRGWVEGAANVQKIKLKQVGNRMERIKPEMSAIYEVGGKIWVSVSLGGRLKGQRGKVEKTEVLG